MTYKEKIELIHSELAEKVRKALKDYEKEII